MRSQRISALDRAPSAGGPLQGRGEPMRCLGPIPWSGDGQTERVESAPLEGKLMATTNPHRRLEATLLLLGLRASVLLLIKGSTFVLRLRLRVRWPLLFVLVTIHVSWRASDGQ